ncbi:hypothetical protein [Salicibibacter kimchii]|uniref:Uncharacterized protein n=1 Tax=Salicibibacter kimchii TaxID=2099786 RepID=A0A345BUH4_9BACI|nr:hypothetical protein [Salicibibacter kimchii]AXF54605.1 hypothetical protein DT065_00290 [Salicibibacter kimchii]
MKYFEFIDPYYALIKAKDKTSACEVYERIVADEPTKPYEKTRNQALNAFLMDEDGEFSELMREFNKDGEALLLVDGGLL